MNEVVIYQKKQEIGGLRMAGYDKTQDKTLFKSEVEVSPSTVIVVGIYQYGDTGKKKLGLSKKIINEGGERWKGFGRVTLEEWEAIQPAIQNAVKVLGTQ